MEQVNIIGIDLAKRSFQLHGARADGSVAFRRKVSRERLLYILGAQQRCVVAMEACASAHYWGREILKLGHEVRLVPPIYVKPFVKRQKNDAADAEAICEAAQRPTMRFVAVKGEEQQARAMLFHTRDLLVRHRTQTINALRGHLAEFGVIAPQGPAHVGRLASALEDPGSGLPGAVRALGGVLLGQIADLDAKIGGLEKELRACARQDEQAARLMTIPGIGPINAMALQAFAPPMESFRRGRDFSAWLGLVPRQHTTGGKPRLGRISKMGQRDLRRLLIIGAMAVVSSAVRRGETNDPWLARMLARKPRMLVAVALANRMARIVWALMTTTGLPPQPDKAAKRGRPSGVWAGRRTSKGKRSTETGSGKPAVGQGAFKPAKLILDPVRASPYGPAASNQPHHEAGQMTAPDHMPRDVQRYACINGGVHR